MRTIPGRRRAIVAMDVMPPWRAFGTMPSTATHDARRWLRPVLLTLGVIAALTVLIGAAAPERAADASPRQGAIEATS